MLGRVAEIETTGDIIAPKLFGEVTNMPAREPLCRECPLAQAAIHGAVPCMDAHPVFQKQRQGVSTLLPASQHSEKVTDCKTEQQRLLLCSGPAWEVVSTLLRPPTMCGAATLIYMHKILQALGKEQRWGMWTAEEQRWGMWTDLQFRHS